MKTYHKGKKEENKIRTVFTHVFVVTWLFVYFGYWLLITYVHFKYKNFVEIVCSIISKHRQVFLLVLISTKINYLIAHRYGNICDGMQDVYCSEWLFYLLRYLFSKKALMCEETRLQNSIFFSPSPSLSIKKTFPLGFDYYFSALEVLHPIAKLCVTEMEENIFKYKCYA